MADSGGDVGQSDLACAVGEDVVERVVDKVVGPAFVQRWCPGAGQELGFPGGAALRMSSSARMWWRRSIPALSPIASNCGRQPRLLVR